MKKIDIIHFCPAAAELTTFLVKRLFSFLVKILLTDVIASQYKKKMIEVAATDSFNPFSYFFSFSLPISHTHTHTDLSSHSLCLSLFLSLTVFLFLTLFLSLSSYLSLQKKSLILSIFRLLDILKLTHFSVFLSQYVFTLFINFIIYLVPFIS